MSRRKSLNWQNDTLPFYGRSSLGRLLYDIALHSDVKFRKTGANEGARPCAEQGDALRKEGEGLRPPSLDAFRDPILSEPQSTEE